MTHAQIVRVSGLIPLVGAVGFTLHIVLRSFITAGADPTAFARENPWVPINALGVVAATLVLLGLPAMGVRVGPAIGVRGLLGVVLIALAWLFFGMFLSLYSMLIAPWLAEKAPLLVAASPPAPAGLVVAFITALLAEFAGAVLLATPFIRGLVRPRWVGWALVAAPLLAFTGDLVVPTGPAASVAVNLLSNVGPVVLMVALGYLGCRMWLTTAHPSPA